MQAPTSIARNSLARLVSDGSHLTFAFLSGIVTARWFQPEGKGAYAALLTLITILAAISTMGLGDAAVILQGRDRVTLNRLASVITPPVLISSVLGAIALWFIARLQLADQGPTLGQAVIVAALSVPVIALLNLFSFVLNAKERIITTSAIRSLVHVLTLVGIIVLVVAANLHMTGGLLAGMLASGVGVGVAVFHLHRTGLGLRPRWDAELLRSALRLGIVIELAQTLLTLASRVDVLFVYTLVGRAEAGIYSVALTMGQLVGFASLALSFALFPRVAQLSDEESLLLTARASRVGLATALASAAVLVVVIPVITPLAFGQDYAPSVPPALILLVGGGLWAEQSLLARARTARGATRLQLYSYGTTLGVMVVLDLLLIPRLGIQGAALASVAGPACGLVICVLAYRDPVRRAGLSLTDFLPGKEDFRFLFGWFTGAARSLVSRGR